MNSSFLSFGISEPVLKAMTEMGFQEPTSIQSQALPILLASPQDFIGLASTGTGKTAAFGVPLIEKIESDKKYPQALILSPTRELALQVADQLSKLGKYKGVNVVTIYGGSSYRTQIAGVKRGAHIVVATPGRLVDFLEQQIVDLKKIKTVVLDEADEMISMGFKEDLEFILKATHSEEGTSNRAACKTWLFSATMSREIRRVADEYLENPQTVQVAKSQGVSDLVEQIYYTIKDEHKNELISRLLQVHSDFHGIIFCQTKMEVTELEDRLQKRGHAVDALHGDKQQREREITLRKFRTGEVRVLVATDVAARGLDIKELTHVINHSLPWDVESYIHRIGRTGRAGKAGTAISLINPRQIAQLRRIQNVTKISMKKGVIPTSDDVATLKVSRFLTQVRELDLADKKYAYALQILEEMAEKDTTGTFELSSMDLLARVVTAIHPEFLVVGKEFDLDFLRGEDVNKSRPPGAGGPRREFRREDRGPRNDRGPRRDYGPRRDASDRGPRREFKPREDRPERSERPDRPRRADHPGIKRHRSGGSKDAGSRRRFDD